ncbi:MAG: hypothetical protein NWF04_08110 [Candidatus Bathyarchaeota archaeon]|nr:hypothetical protein [Candidatus Bathyarchaeota archaeon]
MQKPCFFVAATLTVLGLLVLLPAGLEFEVAEANFVPGPPGIVFGSPANKTYNSGSLLLNVTLSAFFDFENATRQVEYSLDGEENVSVSTVYLGLGEDFFSTVTAQAALPVLPQGKHNITVYATYCGIYNLTTENSKTSHFTIDFNAPYLSILSPTTSTYKTPSVALTFTVDKPVSTMSYRLDHNPPVSITGNTTLTNLSDGYHNLFVYAATTSENTGVSETIRFNINPNTLSPTPTLPSQTPPSSPSTSPSQTLKPSPSVPEFPAWVIMFACVVVLPAVAVLAKRMQKSRS